MSIISNVSCLRPPPILRRVVLVILTVVLLITGGVALLSRWLGGSRLLFVGQIILLTVTLCLIPSITHQFTKQFGRIVHLILETLLYVIVFLGFGLWLFGNSVFGIWIAYAISLILILEIGSNIAEWQKDMTLKRLSRNIYLKGDAEIIEKMARSQVTFYISVPLGLLTGTVIGLIRNQTTHEIVLICFQQVLFFASFILLCFLIYSFRRMCNPMFRTGEASSTKITVKEHKSFLLKVLELVVPPPKTTEEDEQKKDLDLACDVSDLRKIYKYDSLHNTILLVAFIITTMELWGVTFDLKWMIVSFLAMTFIFSELPYAIGQMALHQKILERYIGVMHAELTKKLQENAPVFPPLNILVAFTTAGTAGGFLYILLSQFVQDAFKSIPK